MFTAGQQAGLTQFMHFLLDPDSREFLLMGHPGVGKTYLAKEMILQAINQTKFLNHLTGKTGELQVYLTATTNQAAENLKLATGMDTSTIHSLLGLRVNNDWATGKTSLIKTKSWKIHYNTLIVIDEASMADTELLKLIRQGTVGCKILYILDKNQLLPLYESEVPVIKDQQNIVHLTEIVRQQGQNTVKLLCQKLREAIEGTGPFPDIVHDGVNIIELTSTEFKHKVTEAFTNPNHNTHSAKILAWTNKRTNKYNAYIRSLHYQDEAIEVGEILVANSPVMSGDMMIARNQQEVEVTEASEVIFHEGVSGQWLQLDSTSTVFRALDQNDAEIRIKQASKLKDWPEYFRLKEFFADLRPVHACTVHKSQGSTYDVVFIDLDDICSCNIRQDVLRMLNVAFSRTRTVVYFRGKVPSKYVGSTS